MKKTILILLIYFIVYLLIVIINWIGIYLPQPRSGVADGASGLGRSIASAFFGICSFIALVGGIWSFALFRKPQFINTTQIVILILIAIVSIGFVLFAIG